KIMLHLSGVLGDWKMNKESWRFKVNTRAGGKLFTIKEGLKFDEMVEMVHEDFESMLRDMPKDTPHVFVNSDRQLVSMCEMCKFTPLRLCISVKNGNLGNHDQGFSREDTAVDGKGHGNKNKNVDRQESNQEPEVEVSNFHDAKVIEKGQWFKNKSELSWSIRMLSIERKFRIVVSKSDNKLLVVKYADTSCNCMVRAAKTNPTSEFYG
ncbi:hypothetical protein HID58_074147, partial [Brassica napus]